MYRELVSNWARFQLSSFPIEFDSISFGRNKIKTIPGRNRPFYIGSVRNGTRPVPEQRKKVYSTRCMLRNRLFCKVFEPFIFGIDLECRKKVYSTRRTLRNRLFCNVFEPLISGIDPEYRKKVYSTFYQSGNRLLSLGRWAAGRPILKNSAFSTQLRNRSGIDRVETRNTGQPGNPEGLISNQVQQDPFLFLSAALVSSWIELPVSLSSIASLSNSTQLRACQTQLNYELVKLNSIAVRENVE